MVDPASSGVHGDLRRRGWLLARVRRASLRVAHQLRHQRGGRPSEGKPDPAASPAPGWITGRPGTAWPPWASRDVRSAPARKGVAASFGPARNGRPPVARDGHQRRPRVGPAGLVVDPEPRGAAPVAPRAAEGQGQAAPGLGVRGCKLSPTTARQAASDNLNSGTVRTQVTLTAVARLTASDLDERQVSV